MQRHFEITVKEKGGAVLHPSYIGDVNEAFLIKFFGLDNPDVESYDIREVQYCCFCGKPIKGHPNNAAPVGDGVCCDECNAKKVVPERLRMVKEQ